jgi:benzil reductase ((S)-benzoin forming)
MLMDTFLSTYAHLTCPRTILNISSGAAQRAVDGWGAYSASKAALDALSRAIEKEQSLRGTGVRVHSISPGVVNTAMQEQIRGAGFRQFSEVEKFVAFHADDQLADPTEVARRILKTL